jgi:hypothetical protein
MDQFAIEDHPIGETRNRLLLGERVDDRVDLQQGLAHGGMVVDHAAPPGGGRTDEFGGKPVWP